MRATRRQSDPKPAGQPVVSGTTSPSRPTRLLRSHGLCKGQNRREMYMATKNWFVPIKAAGEVGTLGGTAALTKVSLVERLLEHAKIKDQALRVVGHRLMVTVKDRDRERKRADIAEAKRAALSDRQHPHPSDAWDHKGY